MNDTQKASNNNNYIRRFRLPITDYIASKIDPIEIISKIVYGYARQNSQDNNVIADLVQVISNFSNSLFAGNVRIINYGNTTRMNSIIQCLSHTPQFRDYFLSQQYKSHINTTNFSMNGEFAHEFASVLSHLWDFTRIEPIQIPSFESAVYQFAPNFVCDQHDSIEFVHFLLNMLHEDLNKIQMKPCTEPIESNGRPEDIIDDLSWLVYQRNQSKIVDLFQAQYKSHWICPDCDRHEIKFYNYRYLSLPLVEKSGDDTLTIYDLIDGYLTQQHIFSQDDLWYCSECKLHRAATIKFDLWSFPEILIIHLNRYKNKSDGLYIDYPVYGLDLSRYDISNGEKEQKEKQEKKKIIYDLYAVQCHSGSMNIGHNTAYILNIENEKWYCFDDSSVVDIEKSNLVTNNAYILFYKKCN